MSFSPQLNTRRCVRRTIETTQEKTGAPRRLLQQFRVGVGLGFPSSRDANCLEACGAEATSVVLVASAHSALT
jgi:hypothetical protein